MLIYLCVLHFIADFLLQSREMGQKKSTDLSVLYNHIMIQIGLMTVGLAFFTGPVYASKFAIANGLIHGVIDWNI